MEPRIWKTIKHAIETVTRSDLDHRFFVKVKYSFPADKKKNKAAIIDCLKSLDLGSHVPSGYFQISPNLWLRVIPSSQRQNQGPTFSLGGLYHPTPERWTIPNLVEQIPRALKIKEGKMSDIKHQFSNWWLAVGSHETIGLQSEDLCILKKELGRHAFWDRIVFIDAHDPSQSISLELN